MKPFNVVILGCGIVGGGSAQILTSMQNVLSERANRNINLKNIITRSPKKSADKYSVSRNLFLGNTDCLSEDEINLLVDKVINDNSVDLIVETIGGSNKNLLNIFLKILNAKKHIVTANKALLAEHGNVIFETAKKNNVTVGFEACVCGAIPVIKTIQDSFAGDEIISISGIMNGTSNYILSKMQEESLSFADALRLAQEKGYAEADPTFDIKGIDAAHKLILLVKLAFGINLNVEQLAIKGIDSITSDVIDFAKEMDSVVKLIGFAKKDGNNVCASVMPMMVKKENYLATISGATNALNFTNKNAGKHFLAGAGAGSLETASSIVSDIVCIAKYGNRNQENILSNLNFIEPKYFVFPYNIIFETDDVPGITGFIATEIGKQNINIDTVSHNRHNKEKAVFCVSTMPCTLNQIEEVVKEIKSARPDILKGEPKVTPVLY